MRTFVIKDTKQPLGEQLLRRSGGSESATLERIRALNPQADLERLVPGTVLLVPDGPDLKTGASKVVGHENFADLATEVGAGIKQAAKRVRAGFERLNADRGTVASVLKTAAVKRLVEADPVLKKQLLAVNAQFKADQKRATEAEAQFAEAQALATKELAQLQKLFER